METSSQSSGNYQHVPCTPVQWCASTNKLLNFTLKLHAKAFFFKMLKKNQIHIGSYSHLYSHVNLQTVHELTALF